MKCKIKGGPQSALKPGLPHTITEKLTLSEALVTLGDIEEPRAVLRANHELPGFLAVREKLCECF